MTAVITTEQVKELRERTSAGMMDCKRALTEALGDYDKAVEILRKKGIAQAAKREGREAKEGLIGIECAGNTAAIFELNCETDFVAKTDAFQTLFDSTLKKILKEGEGILATDTFKTELVEKAAKTGEKVQAKRALRIKAEKGFIASYLHSNRRVGVLVELETQTPKPELEALGKEVAMQIAAMRPAYVSREEVPADWVAKEKEILMEQSKETLKSKPEAVQIKIVEGKIAKRFEEVCLLDQRYIKDDSKSVRQYVEEVAKKAGAACKVRRFVRYELGCGSN